MARGNDAKVAVIQKMAEAFGDNWIGEVDKKFYVWANENGEKLQIAIALTCPKTLVDVPTPVDKKMGNAEMAFTPAQPVKISEEEKKNLADLMARLGL